MLFCGYCSQFLHGCQCIRLALRACEAIKFSKILGGQKLLNHTLESRNNQLVALSGQIQSMR